MKNKTNNKKNTSPYLLVILSFIGVILFGSVLLTLPFAHKDGQWGQYMDSLFIATSATCVTGLSTYANGLGGELTLFGQIVVMVMIQIGGLGFITIFTFFISLFQKKLQFKDRLFLSQAVNSNTIAGVSKFVKRVIFIVLITETLGFLLGLPVFLNVESYSTGEALWASAFTSISAFNNAGFDIFGAYSLIRIAENPIIYNLPTWAYYYLCSYIMMLIILGGISFITIIDLVILRKKPKQWNSFVKIVLMTTGILLVSGFVIFTFTDVISGNINTFEAAFQSVTLRTAGFANFDENNLSLAGKVISCLFMFIGGSPISTAGGIKTTTVFIIILCLVRFLQGKSITAFKREYTRTSILKAMSLVFLSLLTIVVGFILVASFEQGKPLATSENIIFEVFSAFGTVGLSAGLTPALEVGSKITIIILMFFGRLGPITLFQIFQNDLDNEENIHFKRVEADVIIG
ncbi:MAG: Trk family potassium uptake protein [Bacilli bacterium]|nr:Trk family potassium uptake protein [Bacilli bacterium]